MRSAIFNFSLVATPSISDASVSSRDPRCLATVAAALPSGTNPAFILYRQHQQATVVRQYPGLPNPEISKIIGDQWSRLPEDQKRRWKALAEEEKARHALQYPDYRYQPRRNGRYSTSSAGPASGQSGGNAAKVDSNGNCVKCGGKTMNPPSTPHLPFSPPPQNRDRLRSPPYAAPPYDSRDQHGLSYHPPHPNHDQRYHPSYRQSISIPHPPIPSVESYGHDLKRRRFDGASIYIPIRDYRGEAACSPRGPPAPLPPPYHLTDMRARDVHGPRSPALSPHRPPYPPGTVTASPAPILQPIKLPQSRRRDSVTMLAPLTSPRSPPEKSTIGDGPARTTQAQESNTAAAMIMSIPVLNKIKILSTVSPSLAATHPASSVPISRGAVVAIDGPDLNSVWGMTSSLKMQLEREGNFIARIFTGPDPAKFFGKSSISTADVLRLAEEWHKVSDEMKRYITTTPSLANGSVDMRRRSSIHDVDMLEAPPHTATWSESLERKSSDATMAEPCGTAKIVDQRQFDNRRISQTSQREEVGDGSKSKGKSPNSVSKPSESAFTGPSLRITRSRSTASPSAKSTSTNITSMSQCSSTTSTGSISRNDTTSPPSPSVPKQLASPTSSTNTTTLVASPIPIALVPRYQLSTTNYCAIHTAISDAYSPGSHWQWIAALWRGAIGPDVTIAVRPAGGIPGGSNDEETPGQGQSQGLAQATTAANGAANWRTGDGPGVEVRLLDYRAVIVRTVGKVGQPPKTGTGTQEAGGGGGVERRESRALLNSGDDEHRKAEEFWEKAKRRVGFEVAEFLRR
ncbi:hypothetical protein DV738_g4347, partial [Chaetothyriales sp. CBS 135597]